MFYCDMEKKMGISKQKWRAIFLAALMLLSIIVGSLAFAGTSNGAALI